MSSNAGNRYPKNVIKKKVNSKDDTKTADGDRATKEGPTNKDEQDLMSRKVETRSILKKTSNVSPIAPDILPEESMKIASKTSFKRQINEDQQDDDYKETVVTDSDESSAVPYELQKSTKGQKKISKPPASKKTTMQDKKEVQKAADLSNEKSRGKTVSSMIELKTTKSLETTIAAIKSGKAMKGPTKTQVIGAQPMRSADSLPECPDAADVTTTTGHAKSMLDTISFVMDQSKAQNASLFQSAQKDFNGYLAQVCRERDQLKKLLDQKLAAEKDGINLLISLNEQLENAHKEMEKVFKERDEMKKELDVKSMQEQPLKVRLEYLEKQLEDIIGGLHDVFTKTFGAGAYDVTTFGEFVKGLRWNKIQEILGVANVKLPDNHKNQLAQQSQECADLKTALVKEQQKHNSGILSLIEGIKKMSGTTQDEIKKLLSAAYNMKAPPVSGDFHATVMVKQKNPVGPYQVSCRNTLLPILPTENQFSAAPPRRVSTLPFNSGNDASVTQSNQSSNYSAQRGAGNVVSHSTGAQKNRNVPPYQQQQHQTPGYTDGSYSRFGTPRPVRRYRGGDRGSAPYNNRGANRGRPYFVRSSSEHSGGAPEFKRPRQNYFDLDAPEETDATANTAEADFMY